MINRKKSILIADDRKSNARLLKEMLKPEGYRILTAYSGNEALAMAKQQSPDLILLNLLMPDMNGQQITGQLKLEPGTRNIPIIMLTGLDDHDSRLACLNAGAEEFLVKPLDGIELRVRVRNMLRIKKHSDSLYRQNHVLEEKVRARTADLHTSHIETIFALTRAAEHRDDDTGNHVRRISHYARHLAEMLGMDRNYCERLHFASPMHDIGKIGIPDSILLKPAPHTTDEFEIMKSHCALGAEILADFKSPYLKMGAAIALHHHEHWDGSGYPAGLSGEEIPLCARIMSVCDVYDALRSKRPYKPSFEHDKAMWILVNGDGRTLPGHFDPAVLNAFRHYGKRFEEIHLEHEWAALPAEAPCTQTDRIHLGRQWSARPGAGMPALQALDSSPQIL